MKKVFFLFILYFIFLSSCEYFTLMSQKEWTEKAGKEDDIIVYAGGYYMTGGADYYPCYWKIKDGNNIERIDLEYAGLISNSILSIYVVDDIVYSCGNSYVNGTTRASYWINTKKTDLEVFDSLTPSYATSIKVHKGIIFIAGTADSKACFWIIGTKSLRGSISINSASCIFINQISSSKYDIYLGGINNNQACYWNDSDNNIYDLPGNAPASVNSIYVIGNNVYSAGYCVYELTTKPSFWENDKLTILDVVNTGTANSIFISNENIYISGYDSVPDACYWKNKKYIPLPTILPTSDSNAQCIYVYNNNICIAGNDNTYACYWINEKQFFLESSIISGSTSIFIVSNKEN